jgi:hypothetical protein
MMRISHIIIILIGVIAYILSYVAGRRAGTKVARRSEAEFNLMIALRTYQVVQGTNWAKARSNLGVVLYSRTRGYERKFGIPTGTNSFARAFVEAKALSARIERDLVPLNSIFTNVTVRTVPP